MILVQSPTISENLEFLVSNRCISHEIDKDRCLQNYYFYLLGIFNEVKTYVGKECKDVVLRELMSVYVSRFPVFSQKQNDFSYVFYYQNSVYPFVDKIVGGTNKNKLNLIFMGIFAHELGHHFLKHVQLINDKTTCEEKTMYESSADFYAGFLLRKMGIDSIQSTLFLQLGVRYGLFGASFKCYPAYSDRLDNVNKGWNRANEFISLYFDSISRAKAALVLPLYLVKINDKMIQSGRLIEEAGHDSAFVNY